MRLAVLHVNHAHQLVAAQHGHGKKRLEAVLGKLVERLKPRIAARILINGNGLLVLCNPSRNSLPHAELQPIHNLSVRIFRGPQNQLVPFEHVSEAGIAFHHR